MELHRIENVEIFRTGRWKGREYTTKDLDAIVANFREFKGSWFRPALKDGHHEIPGKPALGYIDELWRDGDRLMATLVDVPDTVFNAIKSHGYDRVSVELLFDLERNEKKYSPVLWALSLLGVEVPELDGLKPLRDAVYAEAGATVTAFDVDLRIVHFAIWTTAYINDLPDAAFAVISPGGKKDAEGKTVPRSLRHLPHHGSNVKSPDDNDSVDLPHLRNALARLDQTDLAPELKSRARAHLEKHAKALGVGVAAKEKESIDMSDKKNPEHKAEPKPPETPPVDTGKVELLTKDMEAMAAKLKASEEEIQRLKEQSRQERIAARCQAVTIPALREYIRCMYDLATRGEQKVNFSVDDKTEEMTGEAVVDGLVEALNKLGEGVLKEHAHIPEVDRKDAPDTDNPRMAVDQAVRKYMSEFKISDYTEALHKVLGDNSELAAAYNQS